MTPELLCSVHLQNVLHMKATKARPQHEPHRGLPEPGCSHGADPQAALGSGPEPMVTALPWKRGLEGPGRGEAALPASFSLTRCRASGSLLSADLFSSLPFTPCLARPYIFQIFPLERGSQILLKAATGTHTTSSTFCLEISPARFPSFLNAAFHKLWGVDTIEPDSLCMSEAFPPFPTGPSHPPGAPLVSSDRKSVV